MKNAISFLLLSTIEDLISDKTITEVSVEDILRISGVSRSSFYRYYLDKYDLCNQVLGSYVKELIDAGLYKDFGAFLYALLLHIKEKSKFYKNAFSYIGQNSLYRYFNEKISEHLSLQIFGSHWFDLPTEKYYFVKYLYGATLAVLLEWLDSNCKEDPREICNIIVTTMRSKNNYSIDCLFTGNVEL